MIVEGTRKGHRSAYTAYFAELLKDPEVVFIVEAGRAEVLKRGICAHRLLLSTADDYLPFALLLCVFRMLILRRTQLVVIRAEHALDHSGIKAHVKWAIYRLLRDLPLIRCITIMPHRIEPRLALLTNDSIYDPAFFELSSVDERTRNPYGNDLPEGRLPSGVVFLGVLSEARNIRVFLELFGSRKDVEARAFGRRGVDLSDTELAESGYVAVQEGHLEESLFARILASAPSVWCAFGPDYDNFSGVFCNAVRFGTPVWVRLGSRLARFAQMHGGQEVCRLMAGEQIFVLYKRVTIDLMEIKALNEAVFK